MAERPVYERGNQGFVLASRDWRFVKTTTVRTCLDQCEATGRIANFSKAAGPEEGEFEGMYYNDSDVYKVIEGAAYALMLERDAELEAELDEIIEKIRFGARAGRLSMHVFYDAQARPEMDRYGKARNVQRRTSH